MIEILSLLRPVRQAKGFTLIELLVAVAIVGILAAIAIPQFIAYKARAIDTHMKTDLKNAAMAMESYYADKLVYPSTVAAISAVGFIPSAGVTLTITVTTPFTFTLNAAAPNGTQPSYTLNSVTGLIN
jgi:type IV pilus assembly protein PilA